MFVFSCQFQIHSLKSTHCTPNSYPIPQSHWFSWKWIPALCMATGESIAGLWWKNYATCGKDKNLTAGFFECGWIKFEMTSTMKFSLGCQFQTLTIQITVHFSLSPSSLLVFSLICSMTHYIQLWLGWVRPLPLIDLCYNVLYYNQSHISVRTWQYILSKIIKAIFSKFIKLPGTKWTLGWLFGLSQKTCEVGNTIIAFKHELRVGNGVRAKYQIIRSHRSLISKLLLANMLAFPQPLTPNCVI